MTNDHPIIGIVRGWQKELAADGREAAVYLRKSEVDAVTKAIIIAVAALEQLDALEGYEDERCYKTNKIVTDALSHIRSLPSA